MDDRIDTYSNGCNTTDLPIIFVCKPPPADFETVAAISAGSQDRWMSEKVNLSKIDRPYLKSLNLEIGVTDES